NNITLAAVIIVMGMVVDDAIVVSENITRLKAKGLSLDQAAVKGTSFVFLPIIASILTTCVSFVPLFFFSGRFGAMVCFIPLIIFFMLGGSLLEALIILPGHMILPLGRAAHNIIHKLALKFRLKNFFNKHALPESSPKMHWFNKWEDSYERLIVKILPDKGAIFAIFAALLIISGLFASSKMKFVMFPDEETRQVNLTAEAPAGSQRYETARISQPVEDILNEYVGKEVIGFRSEIARTRRGSVSQENKFRMNIEILPKEKRKKSADQLIKEWENKFAQIKNIENLKFSKTWHGQSGESPIEIHVKENKDELRQEVSDKLAAKMKEHPALFNVEIDRPILNPEYRIKLNRDKIRRLAISPSDIASTLRAALEGKILYDFMGDDEEIYVRLTTVESAKDNIDKVLNIPVENEANYLVPLQDIVTVEQIERPDSIEREDLKRTTAIYADLRPGSKTTPLEIAEYFENKVFGDIASKHPSTVLEFAGEVKDTRESQRDFAVAIIMAVCLIYIILTLLFDSLFKSLIIILAIPFGIVGIILAFWVHGISIYGFFAVIGALGLAGVVVNDAIIMLVKLDSDFDVSLSRERINSQVASIAKTRLRAVILTTLTTVAGIIPTAYGWAGYDAMLAQMMLALAWGLIFGTTITLILIPCIYSVAVNVRLKKNMRKVIKVFLFAVYALVFTGFILNSYAEGENIRILPLDEFIQSASLKDANFEEILIDELKLKYKKALGMPAGDLVLSLKNQHNFFFAPDDDGSENTVSLSRLFPYAGTTLTAEYDSSLSTSTRKVSSEFTAYISQPIARNAFGRNTRLLEKIIGVEMDVANFQIVEAYEDYLATLIQLYYNWYSAFENVNTAQNSYNENSKLLENIKEREKHKIALPVDVNKVSLQVAAKEEGLVTLKNKYDEYLNLIKESIRYGGEGELRPEQPSFYDDMMINFKAGYEIFNASSRTSQILAMLEDKASLEINKYADQLLPSIDIIAGYSIEGSGHEIKDRERMVFAGVSMDWPLPGQAERAEYETSKIDFKKTKLSSENIRLRLSTNLNNLYDQIEREKKLISLAQEKITYAESIVEDDRKNYSLGRITLNDIIDEVNKLEDNKFNKIYHEIQLKRLIVEWLRLTDQLVKTNKIAYKERVD
ncbi:efflux RND transporter permease subunit, partial [Candidatus Omnitrophota bacterium]